MNDEPITAKQNENNKLYNVYEGSRLVARDLPAEKAFPLMDELRFRFRDRKDEE